MLAFSQHEMYCCATNDNTNSWHCKDEYKKNLFSQLFQIFCLQEAAYIKIHAEIADVLAKYARPVHEELYEDWSKFLDAFLSQGE